MSFRDSEPAAAATGNDEERNSEYDQQQQEGEEGDPSHNESNMGAGGDASYRDAFFDYAQESAIGAAKTSFHDSSSAGDQLMGGGGAMLGRRGSQRRGSTSNFGVPDQQTQQQNQVPYHEDENQEAFGDEDENFYREQQQRMLQEKLPVNVVPPPPLPHDPIVGAYQKFRVGFLKYSEQEAAVIPVGAPDPFLPAKLADQRSSLSQAPIVTSSMDTVLDALLPPRRATVTYIEDDGAGVQQQDQNQSQQSENNSNAYQETVDVVQRVAHEQIKREELRMLRYELDQKLKESNARMQGICGVRRSIHALMFDELIRQVTIDCPERGILLKRVRDEIQMTLDAYHALYEESVNYSTNRLCASSKYTPAMQLAIDSLNRDISILKKDHKKLDAKQSAMIRCVDEQEASDHKRYAEEQEFLKRTAQRLEDQYNAVLEAQEAQRRALRESAYN